MVLPGGIESDWQVYEVNREEPACVAVDKAALSSAGHYMWEALASKAQLPWFCISPH